MTTLAKSISFAFISILLGVASALLMLEITLRFFPVNEGLHALPVNQDNPILRFEPDRTAMWSKGWNFSLVNRVKTNNYGFVSDTDYDPKAATPLLAIIGDSYVAAAMVPYSQTVAGILARALGPKGRVYSFGSAGSALSQYLAYCEYVRQHFHPAGLVIVVVANDFDESLLKYKSAPAFHYFVEGLDGNLVLNRVDFEVTVGRAFVRRSALGMYLATNLKAQYLGHRIKRYLSRSETVASADPVRVADSQRVVDAFLKMLASMSGLAPSRIVLVVDGMMETIYDPGQTGSLQNPYFDVMRRYLIQGALTVGFEVIDMQQAFFEHYQRNRQRFEFPTDGHWNPVAHAVVAQKVQRSITYRTLFASRSDKT